MIEAAAGRRPAGPVRLAVLGVGAWARRYHLATLAALRREGAVELAGLWNRTLATAQEAALEFDIARVYPSFESALGDEHVDGYVLLVHADVAASLAMRVAARGRPLLTEKPPGRSHAEALALAERVIVPNVVGFNRRYMPLACRFREIVAGIDGAHFAEVHFHRHDRSTPRFVTETGIHAINFIEHVCGPIADVATERLGAAAVGAPARICRLTFASGMPGLLKLFPRSGASVERYEVHGTDRSACFTCPAPFTGERRGRIVVHERGEVALDIVGRDDDELATTGMLDQYRDFLRVFDEPAHATASNFRNAADTMRVAEAIEAVDDGRPGARGR